MFNSPQMCVHFTCDPCIIIYIPYCIKFDGDKIIGRFFLISSLLIWFIFRDLPRWWHSKLLY